jgi:pimeloyl-ACP methyl ester carboxylesterase
MHAPEPSTARTLDSPLLALHFGGNGHAACRLDRVRDVIQRQHLPIELVDLAYPGFDGQPPAADLDAFLDAVATQVDRTPARLAVATGIGALIALTLRARGRLPLPLVLQSPVLWGLEHRRFPRLMRWWLPRALIGGLFRLPPFQKHFIRKHFERPLSPIESAAFFRGYRDCRAFGALFTWFTPALLRDLERQFAASPDRLEGVTVWWGGRDPVVTPAELDSTRRALGVDWPLRVFDTWGHYPMSDRPEEWLDALRSALESPVPAACGS